MRKLFRAGGLTKDVVLENGEEIKLAISRSKLGVFAIFGAAAICLLLLTVAMFAMPSHMNKLSNGMVVAINVSAMGYLYLMFLVLYATIILASIVSFIVYRNNRLIVTNKRVIHYAMTSIFAKSTNVIELTAIEDVSFKQTGIIDYIFKLGTIRMSTVGDETTYTFNYIDTPTDEMAMITHLVHSAKVGKKNGGEKAA